MGSIVFLAFGTALWFFLSPVLELETLLSALIASYVSMRLVGTTRVKLTRLLVFIAKLMYDLLVAVWQSLKLLTRLYDFESKYVNEVIGQDFFEKFEKIVLITLTPYTIVADEKGDELVIHELKERKDKG
ncbi:MAG: Na+/H+ antiporter subunit E [Pseudothermotoga sp.]|uniref:Na+/H+ antiporter subunit E n=1 Tax=Pseudothermotoga sp. TaxID=2033661 RepID=UPI00258E7076|nr:Na+/H+ antiporter subunit E [Pseudothermotoga sp.]MDI6862565.1 Na+/H+ antiporter subunit E [Pseudothermotoga sp.]